MIPSWSEVDGEDLRSKYGFKKFVLINDFIAAGYGIAALKEDEYQSLGSGGAIP